MRTEPKQLLPKKKPVAPQTPTFRLFIVIESFVVALQGLGILSAYQKLSPVSANSVTKQKCLDPCERKKLIFTQSRCRCFIIDGEIGSICGCRVGFFPRHPIHLHQTFSDTQPQHAQTHRNIAKIVPDI